MLKMSANRIDGRNFDQLRPLQLVCGVNPYAEGSAEICCGRTKVLISVSVEKEIPKWMDAGRGGWITAEYGMLPRATHTRNKREASIGRQGGRTMECQRLIGRVLRQAAKLNLLSGLTFNVDCDVIVADGGTRTAAITGAWVALYQAVHWARRNQLVTEEAFQMHPVAAVSVGRVGGRNMLDLCYEEDSKADFDLNLAVNAEGEFIEVQGTAERACLRESDLLELFSLGKKGIAEIIAVQKSAVAGLGSPL